MLMGRLLCCSIRFVKPGVTLDLLPISSERARNFSSGQLTDLAGNAFNKGSCFLALIVLFSISGAAMAADSISD